MTQSQSPEHGAPLADPEGINAGSAAATDEHKTLGGAGVEAGGDPEDAPDLQQGLTGYDSAADDKDDELAGAIGSESSESGQDGGSIE